MNKWKFIHIIVFIYVCRLAYVQQYQPNIVFILADDLGITDVNWFAHYFTGVPVDSMFYETPNIDALARDGVAFTQAYACQLCSPTRAGLLTGVHAARLGFTTALPSTPTYYSENRQPPLGYHALDAIDHHDNISIESPLLNGTSISALFACQPADSGKNALTFAEALNGYHCEFIGKWHLGGHGAKGYQPYDQGFHTSNYLDAGGSPYFNFGRKWANSNHSVPEITQDKKYHASISHNADTQYLTQYLTDRACEFISGRKDISKPFLLYFCHFAVHSPWQAPKHLENYFVHKPQRGWKGHGNATYAAMIKELDESVGAIREALIQNGMADNTIVVFMSDNGGLEQIKQFDITSNQPFRGGKACLNEGGVRVPFIIFDPRLEHPAKVCKQPVQYTDIFPTFLEFSGVDIEPYSKLIDGRSLVPLLTDENDLKDKFAERTFYWHYPFNVIVNDPETGYPLTPHSAIRKGNKKVVVDWAGNLYYYRLDTDPFELNNQMDADPETALVLFNELLTWLHENVAPRYYPKINPDYQPENDPRKYDTPHLINELIYEPAKN